MRNFKNTAPDGAFFLYEVGSVKTSIPWHRPTSEKIKFLIKDIKKMKNYQKYEIFLIGGVVNGKLGKTWDIDIAINGPSEIENLEPFFHEVYDLALNKHNLLVDMVWLDQKPALNVKYRAISFGAVKKIIGQEESISKFGKPISKYLVENEINFPTEKARETNKINCVRI